MLSKKQIIIFIIVGIVIVGSGVGIWTLFKNSDLISSKATNTVVQNNSATTIEVAELAKNANNYLDKNLNLKGVVSFVYPESHALVLIDNKEYANCGVVTCAIIQIPVSFDGQMPAVKDFVIVQGMLSQTSNGKLLFKAAEIKPQ